MYVYLFGVWKFPKKVRTEPKQVENRIDKNKKPRRKEYQSETGSEYFRPIFRMIDNVVSADESSIELLSTIETIISTGDHYTMAFTQKFFILFDDVFVLS